MKREIFPQDQIIADVNELFAKAESQEAKAEILKEFTRCGMLRSEIARLRALKVQSRRVRPKLNMKAGIRRMRAM